MSIVFYHRISELCKRLTIIEIESKMKKNLLLKLLCVICLISLATACNDNDDKGVSWKTTYSNKLSALDNGNLNLYYDGKVLIGKDIYFEQQDANSASIILSGMFPAEKALPVNIKLTAGKEDEYSFSGSATGANKITFNYEGTVSKESMTLNLSNIKLPDNALTATSKWNVESLYFQSDDPTLNTIIPLAGKKINEALCSVLHDVTFHTDGNVTANYALQPDTWIESPTNLVFFATTDNSAYILPNVDMIIKQIRDNQNKTRAEESNQITMEQIEAVYALINKWTTIGIRMNIQTSSNTLSLYLDKTEIEALFPVIPYLKDLIPDDVGGGLGSIISALLPTLAETLGKAKKVDIGITFKK